MDQLYTIAVRMKLADKPKTMRSDWFETGMSEQSVSSEYLSIAGRQTNRYVFIGDQALAKKLASRFQASYAKRGIWARVEVEPVTDQHLNYRRKTAVAEAAANDQKIKEKLGL